MRISDWSSDVCSSDLALPRRLDLGIGLDADEDQVGVLAVGDEGLRPVDDIVIAILLRGRAHPLKVAAGARFGHRDRGDRLARHHPGQPALRSEEHTSELQSLLRISYAVFCLKKKKLQNTTI